MNVYWVQVSPGRSWHVVDTLTRDASMTKTRCGRYTTKPQQDDRPANERTCETCYRIVGPQ